MPRIVLEVTHGPRWSASERRHLQNGEKVVLEAETEEALKRQIALHRAHCRKIVEGDLPNLQTPARTRPPLGESKTAPIAKPKREANTGTVVESVPESKIGDRPKSKKADPAGEKKEGFACPKCGQRFKSDEGLARHFRNSRHDQE